jgi:di/tricarboxylate transporter
MTDTKLATGDTLLVIASASNLSSYQNSKDFYVACSVGSIPRIVTWYAAFTMILLLLAPSSNKVKLASLAFTPCRWDYVPIVNFLLMITLPAFDVIPMEQSAMLFSSICFICGWITPTQALEVIDFSLLIMIASSIGIGRAMESSGVSKALGDFIKDSQFSPWYFDTHFCIQILKIRIAKARYQAFPSKTPLTRVQVRKLSYLLCRPCPHRNCHK